MNVFILFSFLKYRFYKICLLLYLRKPYLLKKHNLYFLVQSLIYIFKSIFFFMFFIKKIKISYFSFSFFGSLLLKRLKKVRKKKSLFINIFNSIIFILLLFFVFYFVFLFQIFFELFFYTLFYKFLNYFFFNFFNNLVFVFFNFYIFYLFCFFFF